VRHRVNYDLRIGSSVLGLVEHKPEENPPMVARLIFELVIAIGGLSIIIFALVTALAELI
jgi:hypothetical protein